MDCNVRFTTRFELEKDPEPKVRLQIWSEEPRLAHHRIGKKGTLDTVDIGGPVGWPGRPTLNPGTRIGRIRSRRILKQVPAFGTFLELSINE